MRTQIADRMGAEARKKATVRYHEPQTLLERYEALPPRVRRSVDMAIAGMKNREIAEQVGTTEQVIKNYLRIAYDILGADSRLQMAMLVIHAKREVNHEHTGSPASTDGKQAVL